MTPQQLYSVWLDDLWSSDLDQLEKIAARVVAPDFVGHWPGRPNLVRGAGQLAAVIREGREMFDDLTFAVEVGPVGDAELVAARWVARGKLQGRDIEFRGHDLLRHSNDVFVEYWVLSEDPAAPEHPEDS